MTTQIDTSPSLLKIAKASPLGLFYASNQGRLLIPTHQALLDEHLLRVASGDIRRLIVHMPPQHGKSTLISHAFPAWYLGTHPDQKILLASYADTFAAWWGGQARDLLREWGPAVFGQTVDPDHSAANWWFVQGRKGYMATSGAQGSFIGRPANVVIIDDPHAGAQEAKSALQRQRIWEWYVAVLRNRLTPPGAIVLVMSRWHEDDLAGRALENAKKGGDQWEYLNLPALAEENDPLDPPRAVGEPLWPGRYDIPWLEDTQRALGSYYFSAQYQGRPTPDVGGMFERAGLRTFAEDADNYILHNPEKPDEFIPKRQVAKFAIVDPAFGENEGNDYTAIGIFGQLKDNRLLVLHIDRGRRQGEDIAVKTIDLARAWDCQWIGVEDVAAQRWLAQMIANRGFRAVKKIRAAGSKEQRAQPAVIAWNNGDIYCAQAEWLDEFMEELSGFDKAAHDDQVDVLSYAALQMVKGGNRPQGVRPIEIGRRTSPWAI